MGFFDRFKTSSDQPAAGASVDEQAIARYRYLLKTAPPEAIEQAHAEAFARLTPEQRQRLLSELASDMPDAERNAAYRAGEAPGALARVATRAELREPGAMERAWNRVGSVPGNSVPGWPARNHRVASIASRRVSTCAALWVKDSTARTPSPRTSNAIPRRCGMTFW